MLINTGHLTTQLSDRLSLTAPILYLKLCLVVDGCRLTVTGLQTLHGGTIGSFKVIHGQEHRIFLTLQRQKIEAI